MRFTAMVAALFALVAGCGLPTAADTDPDSAKSAAPANYTLPRSGTLALIDLANFAKQKRDFIKPDDFSKGFNDAPLNGRHFVVTMPLASYAGTTSGPASWSYDADKEELELSVIAADIASESASLTIQETTETGAKTKMSNAFGAEVEVTPMETWTIAVGRDYNEPVGVFPKSTEEYSSTPFEPLGFSMKLKPEQAKALVADLQVRLEGVVEKDEDGRTVNCGDDHTPATIDAPTEWTKHTCKVEVHLSRVAFVRKNGSVLKEWRDKS